MKKMVHNRLRQNFYTFFGLLLGLLLGPIIVPMMEEECLRIDLIEKDRPLSENSFLGDYQVPKINLALRPSKALKNPQKLLRPRYFSTELGMRKKLFVAVLTTPQTIKTNGVVINKTISHLVDKLTFFVDEPGNQKLNVSYLKLPGIVGFIDTRVVLKPFHVLKYIKDNFIDNYDFFFIINDEAYIKARKLNDFVEKISISQDVYASVKIDGSQYCSLKTGILFSNSVIQRMIANIDWCVKNVLSSLDDDNFGRCALHSTNISCQQLVQTNLFSGYHLLNEDKLDIEVLKSREMREALTIYPVKNIDTHYLLHAYFSTIEISKTNEKIINFRKSIVDMSPKTPNGVQSVTWPIGNSPNTNPATRFDLLRWDYFTETHIYLTNEFNNLRRLNEAETKDIQIIINACVNMIKKRHSDSYEYHSLLNGYRKFDASRGMDYILDMILYDRSSSKIFLKRIQICKPLGKVEMLSVPYVTENRRVNILLPVRSNDRDDAIRFLQQYKTECLEKKEKIFLMLIFIYEYNAPGKDTKDDIFKDLKNKALALTKMYQRDDNRVAWLSIKLPFSHNRAIVEALLNFAIADLSLKKFSLDSMILLSSVNVDIRVEYLNRVRMNTILGWQVFSPIPFTEYHPNVHGIRGPYVDVNKRRGRFDASNMDHISFYVKDYFVARKRIESLIPPLKSDSSIRLLSSGDSNRTNFTSLALNTIYSMFVRFGDVHVLRGVEPALRLKHQELDCSRFHNNSNSIVATLRQSCINKRNANLGSRNQLANLILDFQETGKMNL